MKHTTYFVNLIKLSYFRNKAIQSQKTDLQHWKDDVSHRKRSLVETIFSCIKRMFGQYVTAIILDLKNIVKVIMLEVHLYDWFQSIAIT